MSGKKMSRRELLRLGGVAGGVLLLAACGSSAVGRSGQANQTAGTSGKGGPPPTSGRSGAPRATGPKVTLTIWNSDWGKFYNDPMKKLGTEFTRRAAPNVATSWTFMPNLSNKLAAAIAAGNPPDVAVIDEGYGVPKIARLGGLTSLDSYYSKDGVKQSDFIPFTWETVLYKGKPYGIPGGAGADALVYDKDEFKKAGIGSVPDTPTWEEFREWGQRMTKRDSSGKLVRAGIVPDPGSFFLFAGVLGFQYYNSDRTKVAINSPESVEAVEKWVGLTPKGVSYPEASNLVASAPNVPYGAFGQGKQGIVWDGYWLFLGMDKYWPKINYGLIRLPTPHGKKSEWSMYTGWVWDPCIPKGSKHPDQAWEFLKFGFWQHGALLADTINWTSVLSQFKPFIERTKEIMGPHNRELPYLHIYSEVQYAGKYFVPYTPIYDKLNDSLNQAIDQANRGKKSVKQALDEAAANLQPQLDSVQGSF